MKKIFSIIAASLLLTSCIDTVLLPDDKTVDEDFWKTKSEVSQMVSGAYKAMTASAVIQRLIVWGDFRSDELTAVTSINNNTMTELNEIETGNIETTNSFCTWAGLYSVINDCNIVLDRAENVMSIDPSYTEGDYLTDRSQMLALRSLCYFYLVRNFRDVPYVTQAYMNSSQNTDVPQSAPDSVLQGCIDDLVEAEQNALDPTGYSGWKSKGLINREGIDAILADIYLWRGSVKHSNADYQQCVAYCDKVIASKRANHQQGHSELIQKDYPLADGDEAFEDIFVKQNSEESIFELQYDGSNNSNSGLCTLLYKYSNNNSASGYLQVSSVLGDNSTVYVNNDKAITSDYRFKDNVYGAGATNGTYDVRKMIAQQAIGGNPSTATGETRTGARSNSNFAQNYIFYRLSDIMLMKAEALTAMASGDEDPQLRQAFNLVQAVNSRSIYQGSLTNDSLKWNSFSSQESMESLVLNERLRELSFEGKRWYDLMRYNYRHITPADYSKTFYQISQEGGDIPRNDTKMLSLISRKLTSGGEALQSKLRYETKLYMPVNHSDMVVNYALHQNPAYNDENDFQKN